MEYMHFEVSPGELHIEAYPKAVKAVALKTKKARRLAHLALHMADLRFALEMLELLGPHTGQCSLTQAGVWRSAVVHYAKCFGNSAERGQLSAPKIFKDIPNGMIAHEYFFHLRNKNIVHDENAYSQALLEQ